MRKYKNILINIVLFMVMTIILFLIFEVALRWLGMSCSIEDEYGQSPFLISGDNYKMKPDYDGREKCIEYDISVQTNNEGYRDSEFTASDNRVIFLFGDSMVFGTGVEQDETFGEVLEKVFLKGFSVYNFGLSGYSPKEYVKQYDEYVQKFNPELIIIVLTPSNDAQEDCGIINRASYFGGKRKGLGKVKDILKKSYVVKFVEPLIKKAIDIGESDLTSKQFYLVDEPDLVKECDDVLKNNLKVLKEKAYADNKSLVFVILPNRGNFEISDNPLYDYDKKIKTMLRFCSELDLSCVNLKDRISNPDELYLKEGHLNKKGHYVIAEIIYNELKEVQEW